MTSPIYKLSDSYIDRLAVLDPGAATYMGIPGHDHEMTDFSPAGHDARAALDHDVLTQLNALASSADADRLAAVGCLRPVLRRPRPYHRRTQVVWHACRSDFRFEFTTPGDCRGLCQQGRPKTVPQGFRLSLEQGHEPRSL